VWKYYNVSSSTFIAYSPCFYRLLFAWSWNCIVDRRRSWPVKYISCIFLIIWISIWIIIIFIILFIVVFDHGRQIGKVRISWWSWFISMEVDRSFSYIISMLFDNIYLCLTFKRLLHQNLKQSFTILVFGIFQSVIALYFASYNAFQIKEHFRIFTLIKLV